MIVYIIILYRGDGSNGREEFTTEGNSCNFVVCIQILMCKMVCKKKNPKLVKKIGGGS